ncbi:hypothetical protein D3C80_1149460 [compost metagenome]
MTGAGLLLAGQVIERGEALLAGEHGVQRDCRRHQDQQRGDGANGQDHLAHVQAHDAHHHQRYQHATGQCRNAELLLQQRTTAGQHDHGDGEHEKGDQPVDEHAQVTAADGQDHILVRGGLLAIAQPRQRHAEEGEQGGADQRASQPPHAEIDKEQQQFPP